MNCKKCNKEIFNRRERYKDTAIETDEGYLCMECLDKDFTEVIDLPIKCSMCGIDIEYGEVYHTHKKHGIVCVNCPEFTDGGVTVVEKQDE